MTATHTLSTIEEVVAAAKTLTDYWFRGHSRQYGTLIPTAYRPDLQDRITDLERIEGHFVDGFRLRAASVASGLPAPNEFLDWLILMQHHGTPTRLLDWTENILVALYFVVYHHNEEDGELYALHPVGLAARALDIALLPKHDSPFIRYLAAEPLCDATYTRAHLQQAGINVPNASLPILPPSNFPRIVAQSGTFTIHPRVNYDIAADTVLLSDEHALHKYVIPSAAKPDLLEGLLALGVSHVRLFPELDGLSMYLKQEFFRPAQGPQPGGMALAD